MRYKSYSTCFYLFLLLGVQLNLIQSKDKNTNVRKGLIVEEEDTIPTKRMLATPVTTTTCHDQNCTLKGSIMDLNQDFPNYVIYLGASSKIILAIDFLIEGGEEKELSFALKASPSTEIITNIQVISDDSNSNNEASTLYGSYWENTMTINLKANSTRQLFISIENQSSDKKTVIKLTQTIHESSRASKLLTVVAGVVLIVMLYSLFMVYRNRIVIRRRRFENFTETEGANYLQTENYHLVNLQSERTPDTNRGPLSEENFDDRFPEAELEYFESSFPQKTCSICMEDLQQNQKCRQLYCDHIFHSECVQLWLLNQMKTQKRSFCPNCSKDMTSVTEKAKKISSQKSYFTVFTKIDCPHQASLNFESISLNLQKALNAVSSEEYRDANEVWMCLDCFEIGHLKYCKSHQNQHQENNGHNMTFELNGILFWCFACHSYVHAPNLTTIGNVWKNMQAQAQKDRDQIKAI